jgi:hypothetical protein
MNSSTSTDDNGFYFGKDGEDHVVAAFYFIFLLDFCKNDWLCIQSKLEHHQSYVYTGVPSTYSCGSGI